MSLKANLQHLQQEKVLASSRVGKIIANGECRVSKHGEFSGDSLCFCELNFWIKM